MSSPRSPDDFCLVSTEDLFALPIRSRSGRPANDHADVHLNAEDDYDIISTPGSINSSDSPSPCSPQYDNDGPQGPIQTCEKSQGPSGSCSCNRRMPPFTSCVKCADARPRTFQPTFELPPSRPTLSPYPDRTTLSTSHSLFTSPKFSAACVSESLTRFDVPDGEIPGTSTLALPTNRTLNRPHSDQASTLHDHASLDRAIMDRLINHAIESQNRAQDQSTSLSEGQLAMKMLVRLLKLPPDHRVSQELVRLQPTLFHPLYREVTQRKAIFEKVFTRVEQNALYAIVQAHKCNFRNDCIFTDCLHSDVKWLSDTDETELHQSGSLASKIQIQCIIGLSPVAAMKFLHAGSDLKKSTLSALSLRHQILQNGDSAMRADANLQVLYSRVSAADYEFSSGKAGFSCIETMAMAESFIKAVPDLVALRRLHVSRLPSPDPSVLSARLKREASSEALSTTDLANPPWKRVSLPHRTRLYDPNFTHIGQTCSVSWMHSGILPSATHSVGQTHSLRGNYEKQDEHTQKAEGLGYSRPPWNKPITDFDGDVGSLGLHPKTLQNLKEGSYPCYHSLAEIRQTDREIKLGEQRKACPTDYEQQLILLEQQNRARLARNRLNERIEESLASADEPQWLSPKLEKPPRRQEGTQSEIRTQPAPAAHPLRGYEFQLQLLELQSKKRYALAKVEGDPSKKEWAEKVIREYDVQYKIISKKEEKRKEVEEVERKEAQRRAMEEQLRWSIDERSQHNHSREQLYGRIGMVDPAQEVMCGDDATQTNNTLLQTSWQHDAKLRYHRICQHKTISQDPNWQRGQKAEDTKSLQQDDKLISNSESCVEGIMLEGRNVSDTPNGKRPKRQEPVAAETPLPMKSIWEQRYQRENNIARAAKEKGESLAKYQMWLLLKEEDDLRCREETGQSRKEVEAEKTRSSGGCKPACILPCDNSAVTSTSRDVEMAQADRKAFEPERRVW